MKRWIAQVAIAWVLSCAAVSSLPTARAENPPIVRSEKPQTARAENPPYVFLQPTTPGNGYYAPRQPYAYGWFGVCPQRMYTVHWSYYEQRWIWR